MPVDQSFNGNIRFTLTWTGGATKRRKRSANCDQLDLQVTSPDGTVIGQGDSGYERDDTFSFIYIYATDNQVIHSDSYIFTDGLVIIFVRCRLTIVHMQ